MRERDIELIGVPFDGYARSGHQDHAATTLLATGLLDALTPREVHTGDELELPARDPRRGPDTGLRNEPAIVAMTEQLAGRVAAAATEERFPLVVGGDCTVLLGIVAGLRDAIEEPGVLFVDAHEDTMPLDVVEDGEAANCEIGLLLGLTGRLLMGPLARRLPALTTDRLAMLGQNDDAWRRHFNIGSVADLGVWSRPYVDVAADPAGAGREAAQHLRDAAMGWWLHVDLDVLSPAVFSSRDLPQPPEPSVGLDWHELDAALTAAASVTGCIGASIAIYDPAHDRHGRDAERITALIGRFAEALTPSGQRRARTDPS